MKASVLNMPPVSGSIEEVHFHAAGDCAWILFEPLDMQPWVGVFGKNRSKTSVETAVAILETPPVAYVIAEGNDYLVDHATRRLLAAFQGSEVQGVVALQDSKRFVIWNGLKFQAIDSQGTVLWTSRRVSWDGIRDVHFQDSTLVGEAWSPMGNYWASFTLDVATGEFSEGSYTPGPWDEGDS